MKQLVVVHVGIGLVLAAAGLFVGASPGEAMPGGDKPQKPVLGDKDELTFQNQRYLKVKNDTDAKLTVFFQYRTLKSGAWAWLPGDPKTSTEAFSFELEAGKEFAVKVGEEPLSASRVRIWATAGMQ